LIEKEPFGTHCSIMHRATFLKFQIPSTKSQTNPNDQNPKF